MKAIAIAGALALAVYSCAGAAGDRRVDLNAPGALEKLRRVDPAHYAKVERILAEVQDLPSDSVPRWMRARFDAKQVDYGDFLLTSYPPQKRLAFSLDDTRYFGTVTLTHDRPSLIRAAR